MGFGVDGVVDLLDFAIVDHVGDPLGVAHAVAIADHIVGRRDRPRGIGQEGERQIEFLGEGLMGCLIIQAHAKYRDALAQVLVIVVPEATGFFGATGCVILGIEVHHHHFASVVGELDGVAIGVFDGEVRGDRANSKSHE